MDRTIYYTQEQLRSFDLASSLKDSLYGLAYTTQDLLGSTGTIAAGLAATQAATPSLTINIAAGRVYELAAADASTFGPLPADAATIVQQGDAAAQQITLSTSGISAGQSRWSLVQVAFSQVDAIRAGDPTAGVLFYYNSANPSQPFQGPGNSGSAQNTVRQGICTISVVSGTPATTGSEVPPSATSGNIGLYLIDLTFGQTTIVNSQILTAGPSVGTGVPNNYPVAPLLAGLLNQHHKGISGQAPKISLTQEVQGILPMANLPASSTRGGLSAMQAFAGNPNGSVAGTAGVAGTSPPDLCEDTTSGLVYTCTTSGTTSSAVWTLSGSSQIANQGSAKNLKITNGGTPTTQALITADSVILGNGAGGFFIANTVSETITNTASGANGLDTGSLTASTCYFLWLIYNPSTTTLAGLMSLSATSPTLPSGYTFKARVGAAPVDSASHFYRFLQTNKHFQFEVQSSGNTANLPALATGTQGSGSVPTWISTSLAALVPSTAESVIVVTIAFTNSNTMVAPNANYGTFTSSSNPAPIVNSPPTQSQSNNYVGELLLEAASIQVIINGASNGVFLLGWRDT